MTVITPWEIYWVLQLDSLNGLFVSMAILGGMLSLLLVMGAMLMADDDPDVSKRCAWFAKLMVTIFAIGVLGATFVPPTKTAAAMVVLPAIVNNPTVQHETGDLYKLAKQALQNAVAPEKKE